MTSCRAQDQASPRVVHTPEPFLPFLCSGSQKASSPVATLCAIYFKNNCERDCFQVAAPEAKSAGLGTTTILGGARRPLLPPLSPPPRTTATPALLLRQLRDKNTACPPLHNAEGTPQECVGARGSPPREGVTFEIVCVRSSSFRAVAATAASAEGQLSFMYCKNSSQSICAEPIQAETPPAQ